MAIHKVDHTNFFKYEQLLHNIGICDRTWLSRSFEALNYAMLDEEGFEGYFLVDESHHDVYASVIFDLRCVNQHIPIHEPNSACIGMLCRSFSKPVQNLTATFLSEIIHNWFYKAHPEIRKLFLIVAGTDNNQRAISFYQKFGFVQEEGRWVLDLPTFRSSRTSQTGAGVIKRVRLTKRRSRVYRKRRHRIL